MKKYYCGITELIEWSLEATVSTEIVELKFNTEDIITQGCLDYEEDEKYKYNYKFNNSSFYPKGGDKLINKTPITFWFHSSILTNKYCKEPCCPNTIGDGKSSGAIMIRSAHGNNKITFTDSSTSAQQAQKGQPALATTWSLDPKHPTLKLYGGTFNKDLQETVKSRLPWYAWDSVGRSLDCIFKLALNQDGLLEGDETALGNCLDNLSERLAKSAFDNVSCNEANQFCQDCVNTNTMQSTNLADPSFTHPLIREQLGRSNNEGAIIKIVRADQAPDLLARFNKNQIISDLLA